MNFSTRTYDGESEIFQKLLMNIFDENYSKNEYVRTKLDIYKLYKKKLGVMLLQHLTGHRGYYLPIIGVSALTWFIRNIYVWNLQFPNNVIYQN